MFKKSWPISYNKILTIMGQDFLDIQYSKALSKGPLFIYIDMRNLGFHRTPFLCPRSLDPIYMVTYYKKMGQHFLDINTENMDVRFVFRVPNAQCTEQKTTRTNTKD